MRNLISRCCRYVGVFASRLPPHKNLRMSAERALSPNPTPGARARVSRPLLLALALSVLAHLVAGSLLEIDPGDYPDPLPLTAELRTLPPPPLPQAAVPTQPKRPRPAPSARTPTQQTTSVPPPAAEQPRLPPPQEAEPVFPDAAPYSDTEPSLPFFATPPPAQRLPPKIDLVYTVLYGSIGLHIGESSYRFEHRDGYYSIQTVGEAHGLLALLYRGKLRASSHGRITLDGLQPEEVAIERGSAEKREAARLDWQALTVTFRDGSSAALPAGTLDLLSFLLQFYFVPPGETRIAMNIVTPRRLNQYHFERKGIERVHIAMGDFDAELWSRTAVDGSEAEALVWFAPEVGHVPVKIRVKDPQRGTGELRLARILGEETAP